MKTMKGIFTLVMLVMSMVLYSQTETHIHTAYATGTTETVMDSQLYETYSVTVVDWDESLITINGMTLVIGDVILIRSKGVLEFSAYSEDGDSIQIQLTELYMVIKDEYKRASIYIKYNEI